VGCVGVGVVVVCGGVGGVWGGVWFWGDFGGFGGGVLNHQKQRKNWYKDNVSGVNQRSCTLAKESSTKFTLRLAGGNSRGKE